MGEVKSIRLGDKFITKESLDKIKTFSEHVMTKLYVHTNDPVQMLLIEEICRLRGYNLSFNNDPEPEVA